MFLKPREYMRSYLWHVVHNLIAHPFLCLPQKIKWPDKFHDWTANKAYYTVEQPVLTSTTLKDIDVWELPKDETPKVTISC